MTVKEGFWGENRRPLMVIDYMYGNKAEVYKKGTLNIPDRVNKLFDEYFESLETGRVAALLIEQVV